MDVQSLVSEIITIKPEARILDATAGNRNIWKTKESSNVIWIDIEKELEFKPDILLDCTKTHFPDNYFFSIFFDPPHDYGLKKNHRIHTTPSKKVADEKWDYGRTYTTYYGWDKYNSQTQLLSFIHKAQNEFYRILKDNGMLWLKWCEIKLPLYKILPFFKKWNQMMRLYVAYPGRESRAQTYWIMFMKKSEIIKTLDLADFTNMPEKENK